MVNQLYGVPSRAPQTVPTSPERDQTAPRRDLKAAPISFRSLCLTPGERLRKTGQSQALRAGARSRIRASGPHGAPCLPHRQPRSAALVDHFHGSPELAGRRPRLFGDSLCLGPQASCSPLPPCGGARAPIGRAEGGEPRRNQNVLPTPLPIPPPQRGGKNELRRPIQKTQARQR
jgi:hypothetical protein